MAQIFLPTIFLTGFYKDFFYQLGGGIEVMEAIDAEMDELIF